ncbi:hypothetical protein CRENBAI_011956, partial [Crenichthys baileyi]
CPNKGHVETQEQLSVGSSEPAGSPFLTKVNTRTHKERIRSLAHTTKKNIEKRGGTQAGQVLAGEKPPRFQQSGSVSVWLSSPSPAAAVSAAAKTLCEAGWRGSALMSFWWQKDINSSPGSKACRSKLCPREFPAETLSLQAEAEGRTTAPHHRGYGTVQLVGGQKELSFIHSYGG